MATLLNRRQMKKKHEQWVIPGETVKHELIDADIYRDTADLIFTVTDGVYTWQTTQELIDDQIYPMYKVFS